eukprot:6148566-Ditylum_brightwellii.AAC.2
MQTNTIAQSIGFSHALFRQERRKRWILHCLSKEAHRAAITLASASETAKTVVLNLVKTCASAEPEGLVQIDKAQSLIKVMHQITLIRKALNQVIRKVNALGAYCHIQTMTVDIPAPTLQAWLPLEEPLPVDKLDLNLILEAQLLHEPLFRSKINSENKNKEEEEGQEHHPDNHRLPISRNNRRSSSVHSSSWTTTYRQGLLVLDPALHHLVHQLR